MSVDAPTEPQWLIDAVVELNSMISSNKGVSMCDRCLSAHQYLTWNRITNLIVDTDSNGCFSATVGWAMCPAVHEPLLFEAWEPD